MKRTGHKQLNYKLHSCCGEESPAITTPTPQARAGCIILGEERNSAGITMSGVPSRHLWVGGLPEEIGETGIKELFSK